MKMSPMAGENKNDFIDRCMGDEDMMMEYPNEKDRRKAASSAFFSRKLEGNMRWNEAAEPTVNVVEQKGNAWCVLHGHAQKEGSATDKPKGSVIKCFEFAAGNHESEMAAKKKAFGLHYVITRPEAKANEVEEALETLGGSGSGNFGHEGRPGEVGGSGGGGGDGKRSSEESISVVFAQQQPGTIYTSESVTKIRVELKKRGFKKVGSWGDVGGLPSHEKWVNYSTKQRGDAGQRTEQVTIGLDAASGGSGAGLREIHFNNEQGPTNLSKGMQLNSLKHLMSSLIRKEEMDGREYIVVPTVLITEGVHNNAFYSSEELAKFPEAWNGEPVVIWHPSKDGKAVTANSPNVREKQTIGNLYNCSFDDGKLKGECWIDEEKAKAKAPEVLEMLEKEEPIEVSTGLFTEDELVENGNWNGETYTKIVHNFRPDHLALLPGGKGACSWEDGAGMPRLNEQTNKEEDVKSNATVLKKEGNESHPADHYLVVEDAQMPSTWHLRVKGVDGKPDHRVMGAAWAALHGGYRGKKYEGPGKAEAIAKLTKMYKGEDMSTPSTNENLELLEDLGTALGLKVNEMSFNEIRQAIGDALRGPVTEKVSLSYCYPVAVYPDSVVYSESVTGGSLNKMMRRAYKMNTDGSVQLVGSPEEVRQEINYIPVSSGEASGGMSANKEEGNMDRKQEVTALIANGVWAKSDEESLMKMNEADFAQAKAKKAPEAKKEEKAPEVPKANAEKQEAAPETLESVLANVKNPQVRETLSRAIARDQKVKDNMVKELTANTACKFPEAELKAMSIEGLERLLMLAGSEKTAADFSAQAPAPQVNAAKDEVPAMPALFAKKA